MNIQQADVKKPPEGGEKEKGEELGLDGAEISALRWRLSVVSGQSHVEQPAPEVQPTAPEHCKWSVMVTLNKGKWHLAVFLDGPPDLGVKGTMCIADTRDEAIEGVAQILKNTYSETSLYPPSQQNTASGAV